MSHDFVGALAFEQCQLSGEDVGVGVLFDDRWPKMMTRGEHAPIANLIDARRSDQGGESGEELSRGEFREASAMCGGSFEGDA